MRYGVPEMASANETIAVCVGRKKDCVWFLVLVLHKNKYKNMFSRVWINAMDYATTVFELYTV